MDPVPGFYYTPVPLFRGSVFQNIEFLPLLIFQQKLLIPATFDLLTCFTGERRVQNEIYMIFIKISAVDTYSSLRTMSLCGN